MSWIITNIYWVLVIGGLLTTSMVFPMLFPKKASKYIFGEIAEGALGTLFTRSWGQMIFSTGLLLVYAAYHPEARLPILVFASFTKLTFAILAISNGRRYLHKLAMPIAFGDLTMVLLFVWYLLAVG